MDRPRRVPTYSLLLVLAVVWPGCAEDDGSGDELPAPAADVDPLVVPTDAESLLPWLAAEAYLEWPEESAIHASTGPHFGNVRTWVHPTLEASLADGAQAHPAGAAMVKELYGDGESRRGWAVSVKTDAQGEGGVGWYWYEWYDGGVVASGTDIGLCRGCHEGGVDGVLSPFPLQ